MAERNAPAKKPGRPASGPARKPAGKAARKPSGKQAGKAAGVPFDRLGPRPSRKPPRRPGTVPPALARRRFAGGLGIVLALLLLALMGLKANGGAAPPSPPLAEGPVSVRIFNGWTIGDVDSALFERGLAGRGAFRKAADLAALSRGLPFAEGFFLAGDYQVQKGEDLPALLAEAASLRFMEAAQPLFPEISKCGLSLSDCAIIASMISAETKNSEDYPLISSVIHNRLEAGMPLGIDATSRYETGDWSSPLAPEVFERRTPYNTRRKAGLPPTGICCPCEETLRAAVLGEAAPWFYYRHDSEGRIHMSRTYEEHLESKRLFP